MRRYFVLISKIIGLLLLYSTLGSLGSLGFMLSVYWRAQDEGTVNNGHLIPLIVSTGMLILLLGMVWMLLFRTERIADLLGVACGAEGESDAADRAAILTVGTKLIGLYSIATAVPSLLVQIPSGLYELGNLRRIVGPEASLGWKLVASQFGPAIGTVLKLAVGLLLVLYSNKVVRILWRRDAGLDHDIGLPHR